MAKPTTSYDAVFPGDLYPGNISQERDLSNNPLVVEARRSNEFSQEIRAIQAFIGLAASPFDPSGPDPGTGTTILDRLYRIGGSANGCLEDGQFCNYSGPDGIDPSAVYYIDTTAAWAPWVNPTGIPGAPNPAPQGPAPTGVPWPGPGVPDPDDPKPPDAPGTPSNPFVPPPPVGPNGPFSLAFRWFFNNWIQFVNWALQNTSYRFATQSAETLLYQPRAYDDLFNPIRTLIELLDGWPSTRDNPSTVGVASIFDVLTPLGMLVEHLRNALGIDIYVGTISGNTVVFDTGSVSLDTGAPGTSVNKIVTLLSNMAQDLFAGANLVDLQTNPGGSPVLGTGVVAAGTYQVTATGPLPTNAEVLVIVNRGYTQQTVQGDENTWREEQIAGSSSFVTTEVPVDGRGGRPLMTVWARTGAGAAWVPLNYSGGTAATNANDYGYTVGSKTIATFGAAGYMEVRVLYMNERI